MTLPKIEEAHPEFDSANREGLELILDYSEDRTSHKIENNHALIYLETIGKICFKVSLIIIGHVLAPLKLEGEGIYSLSVVKEVAGTASYLRYDEQTR